MWCKLEVVALRTYALRFRACCLGLEQRDPDWTAMILDAVEAPSQYGRGHSSAQTRHNHQQMIAEDATSCKELDDTRKGSVLGGGPSLRLAALHFDATRATAQDTSWRSQQLMRHSRSPRLRSISAGAVLPRSSAGVEGLGSLSTRSTDEIVQMLIDNKLNTATFLDYLRQHHGSPTSLMPWLQTLSAIVTKVGLLLESTRFLTCDLQLARILLHMQTSAKALCGSQHALAVLVNSASDSLYKVCAPRPRTLPSAGCVQPVDVHATRGARRARGR